MTSSEPSTTAQTPAPTSAVTSSALSAKPATKKKVGRKSARRRPRRGEPDTRPPRFDVSELVALEGSPLWQAVHPAEVTEVTEAAVFVEVRPAGHDALRAMIDPAEFGGELPPVGAAFDVRLLDPPQEDTPIPAASKRHAEELALLSAVERARVADEEVQGVIAGQVKGGFAVALGIDDEDAIGSAPVLRAFLPKSHGVHSRLHFRPGAVVGEHDTFKVTELELDRANIVLSRKARLKAQLKASIDACWEQLKVGARVTGKVRALVPYGAFVDVGGVDGLLHASDLSWDRQPRVSNLLHVGQVLELEVLVADRGSKKLKLGLKQLKPNPWRDAAGAYAKGAEISGTVVALADYGAFVKLDEGVEGLIHLSEVTWDKIKHPSQKFQIGDEVRCRILDVDADNQRISLSSKALEPNPFERVREKFPAGTVLTVTVRSLVDFGAFVRIEDNVDGLIHIGELSWTERYDHPSEVLTIGQSLDVVVLDVDVERQRVSCSVKQLQENPWAKWEKTYARGSRHTLKVSRVVDQGAEFELDEGLRGFCPKHELAAEQIERAHDVAKVGESIELEVRSLDRRHKKVLLSARAVIEGDTREAYKEYKARESEEGAARMTLGDALKGKLPGTGGASASDPSSGDS